MQSHLHYYAVRPGGWICRQFVQANHTASRATRKRSCQVGSSGQCRRDWIYGSTVRGWNFVLCFSADDLLFWSLNIPSVDVAAFVFC